MVTETTSATMVNGTNVIAGIDPPTVAFAWPSLPLDRNVLIACVARCRRTGVGYRLGAKAGAATAEPGEETHGFAHIDCSGFVGWTLAQSTAGHFTALLNRGSVEQHDWLEAHGFKRSSPPACCLRDGTVRVAFLSPADGGGIGHVLLVTGGETIESHGGLGPDRRAWDTTAHPWMGKCAVYVLAV